MRTCSVKRPCINSSYNVQVVIRVYPTPQRGTGVGKERGSHEGENLRDRVRGGRVDYNIKCNTKNMDIILTFV